MCIFRFKNTIHLCIFSKQKLLFTQNYLSCDNGNIDFLVFDSAAGTRVEELNATDLDTGENAEITYRIQQGSFNDFQIDNRSGVITIAKPLDYDIRQNYTLEVVASDKGIPSLSGKFNLISHGTIYFVRRRAMED